MEIGVFDALFGRLRVTVERSVAALMGKAVLIFFLAIAGIFFISALNNYLHTLWGPVGANLAMAGLFCALAAIIAIRIAVARSKPVPLGAAAHEEHRSLTDGAENSVEQGMKRLAARLAVTPKDAELAVMVAKAAVPFLLPRVLKLAVRNLPVVGAAAAGAYLLSRYGQRGKQPQEPSGRH